jgi:hypothetical protein
MHRAYILSKLIADGRWISILGGSAALFVFVSTGQSTLFLIGFYRERLSGLSFALWLAAVVAETFLPALTALSFWQMARRHRYGWVLHLILLPVLWVIVWAADGVILYAAAEPDMDGPSGWATLPATLLLIIVVVTYYSSLAAVTVRASQRATGS